MGKENQACGLAHNALAMETTIIGNVVAPEDIRIDGTVEGNITCTGKVIVGPKGRIVGDIEASNVEVMGYVKGDITVKDALVLKATAVFEGNIETRTLTIEPQATLNGKCTMTGC